jgi:hypothetical protein
MKLRISETVDSWLVPNLTDQLSYFYFQGRNLMAQKIAQTLPKIGYLYHYPRIDHPTDNFRLDIHITSEPTNQHFDVLRLQLPIKTDEEYSKPLKVTHPWHYQKGAEVSPGVVIMEDRKEKKEEAFTFGGKLTIDDQDQQTFCVLVSAAPIIEISGARPANRQFVEEVEVILAEKRANYASHYEYEKQLNKTNPLELYIACLNALLKKYEHFQHKTESQYQFLGYLHSQQHRLEAAGLIKNPILPIDDLFDSVAEPVGHIVA